MRGEKPISRSRSVLSLLPAFLIVTLLTTMSFAANDIETNYRRAIDAYDSRDWKLADRLSALTLKQIESQELGDWVYEGERTPFMTYFTGDLVYMATSDRNQQSRMNRIEIYDPKSDNLVRVFDYNPLNIFGSTHSPNFTVTYLERENYLGYRIAWFEKGKPETEKVISREEVERLDCPRLIDANYWEMWEKGPRGWGLSVFDPATGVVREVHDFKNANVWADMWRESHFQKGDNHWKFFDRDRLYALEVGSWEKELILTLPFVTDEYDHYKTKPFEKLTAVRNDTLYTLRKISRQNYDLRMIHLPRPLQINHWTKKIDFDESGKWFAESDSDSLRIYKIIGDRARLVLGTTSCVGATYILEPGSVNTFWKGDTLIHFGNAGLKIYKDTKPIYTMDNEDVLIHYNHKSEFFIIYRVPNEFSVFDIKTLRPRWKDKYTVTQLQLFRLLKDRYFLISHIDGTSLLDIRSGSELLRIPDIARRTHEVNQDSTKILLGGETFLGVYEIPNVRRLKGDLTAVAASSKWALQDTSTALAQAREAISLGMDLSSDLSENLLRIFHELKLHKESIRLIGNMAIRTDEAVWTKKLKDAGAEFLIQPALNEFFTFFALDDGIFAFPVFTYPFSLVKGEPKKCFWFGKPKYRPEKRIVPLSGLSITQQNILFFEYRKDDQGKNLIWSPLNLTESGELENLGPLLTTPIEETDLDKQYYFEYAVEGHPFETNTTGRTLANVLMRMGGIGGTGKSTVTNLFAAGIDLTGNGKNWYDTTLVHPVRVGKKFYAHKLHGHLVCSVTEGSQADSIGVKQNDIVLSFGGHPICNTMQVNRIKTLFPDRYPLDFTVVRGADTLSFTVLNGIIGFIACSAYELVEVDPETGNIANSLRLPPGYEIKGANTSGELVYTFPDRDSLLFFDPATAREKRVVIKEIGQYQRYYEIGKKDILLLHKHDVEEVLALDVSKTADDEDRILWKDRFENVYQLYGSPRYCYTEDIDNLPIALDDGTLLLLDMETGSVRARETLPYQDYGFIPQMWNGKFYGAFGNNIFGWRLAYFHPPFPWKHTGYGAIALVPLLFVSLLYNRHRIERLKRKQIKELKRAEIDAEISAARKLQAGLIPTGAHKLGDFHVVGKFISASEVAGDYFDYRLLDDRRLAVVMGDVSGHGLPAGILVSMAKASLMTVNRTAGTDLKTTLDSLNEVVRNGSPGKDMFMTLCYLLIDPVKEKISCSANGHPFPLIARKDGTVVEIGANGGYPLGIRDEQDFEIIETAFHPGDTILVYTDGLPEQMNVYSEPWGYENFSNTFKELVYAKNPENLVNGILERALQYTGQAEREDDMALVAIRYIS